MSSDSAASLVTRFGRLAKRVLPIEPVIRYVRTTRQHALLTGALDELARDPWSVLDAGSDIPRRLIEGWGNAAWSTDDEYLIASIEELGRTVGPVLECGSGLSTIVLGMIARQMGRELWTLEHHAHWGERVGKALSDRGVTGVRLCVKPLKNYGDYSWYDPPLAEMPRDFGLVICDGPPGGGHGGRSGFLPIMRDRLAAHCTILLDDTIRDAEKDIAHRWSSELNAPAEFCGKRKSFAAIRAGQPKAAHPAADCAEPAVVTIGLAADGSEDTLAALESMRNQTIARWSLLVSGIAPGDPTHRRCTALAEEEPRIHCYPRHAQPSAVEVRNGLVRKARSPYFKWLRPGEEWDEDALAACVAALEADGDAVLAFPAASVPDTRRSGGRAAPPAVASSPAGIALLSSDPVQRFTELLTDPRPGAAPCGVIRTSALRNTALLPDVRGAGLVLLAELALQGKFVAVAAGMRVPLARRAEGPVGNSSVMPLLRRAAWRSSLGFGSKLACLRFLSARAAQLREAAARLDGEPA